MAACRGGVLTVTGNPQGGVSAPPGTIAFDGVCWYRKLYGGTTPYGWYRWPDQFHSTTQHLESWVARGVTAANAFAVFGIGAPNGLMAIAGTAGLPASEPNDLHVFGVIRTAAANPSNALVRCGTIASANASVVSGNSDEVEYDWDLLTVVKTTAIIPATVATTLADIRLWSGAIIGNNVEIAGVGSIADSDLIYTCMATQIGLAAGMYGVFFRFSTIAADAGWSVVTANDNGAVSAQTVTPIVAIAADTEYRLRLRYRASDQRIFASVNDGTEVEITANVGPGTAGAGIRFLKPQTIVTCKTAGASKSLGWAKTTLFFGGC